MYLAMQEKTHLIHSNKRHILNLRRTIISVAPMAIQIFRVTVAALSGAVTQRCSVKKVFLEISQNSQENTCARVSFLIKLQTSSLQLY